MTPAERFQRLKAWFEQCIDLDESARDARVAAMAAEDAILAEELRALLRRFDAGDLRPPEPVSVEGRRIGPYRLQRALGRGGMGEVFLAERIEGGFEQQVALKLVRHGGLSSELTRRFMRERQILARLTHPGIARLIDGGVGADGQPWLAMEYVEGRHLIAYARDERLDLRSRLRLWLAVAEAVSYAHRHLIVHRDLKPANVLVNGDGQVKLLDFGVAALLTPEHDAATTTAAFTPRYASPEQIAGEAVTTATDVHGLGLLLFELLSGRPPFEASSDLALRQAIVSSDPPSLRQARATPREGEAIARLPVISAADSRRLFGGELDAIIGKALRKPPAERYATASEFAQDVQRFLRGEAVQALRAGPGYRLRKFVARHRALVAAIALAIAGLSVGLLLALHQRGIAQAAQRRAQSENALLVDLLQGADPYNLRGADLRMADLLDDAARGIAARADVEAGVRAPLLELIGNAQYALTRYAQAEVTFGLAHEAQLAASPRAPARVALLEARQVMARFETGQRDLPATALDQAIALSDGLDPASRVDAYLLRAHYRRSLDRLDEALADIDAARAACGARCGDALDADMPMSLMRLDVLSRLKRYDEATALGDALWRRVADLPEAFDGLRLRVLGAYVSALSFADRLDQAEALMATQGPLAERFYHGTGNRLAGIVFAQEGIHRRRGHLRLAATAAARAGELFAQTLPESVYVAYALRTQGTSLRQIGEYAAAAEVLTRSATMYAALQGETSTETQWARINIAANAFERDLDAPSWREFLRVADAYLASDDHSLERSVRLLMAELALRRGDWAVARAQAERTRAGASDPVTGDPMRQALIDYELARASDDPSARAARWREVEALIPRETMAVARARYAAIKADDAPVAARAAACAEAKAAWDRVDPQGQAWRAMSRTIAACRDPR